MTQKVISEKGLVELDQQSLFRCDIIDQLAFYEHRVQGKTCKIRFNMGQQRTKGILERSC